MSAPVFGRHSSYRNDIHVVSRYLKLSFIELCMHHSFDIWSYVLQRRHNVLQRKILEAWPLYANINDSSLCLTAKNLYVLQRKILVAWPLYANINDSSWFFLRWYKWFSLLSSHMIFVIIFTQSNVLHCFHSCHQHIFRNDFTYIKYGARAKLSFVNPNSADFLRTCTMATFSSSTYVTRTTHRTA